MTSCHKILIAALVCLLGGHYADAFTLGPHALRPATTTTTTTSLSMGLLDMFKSDTTPKAKASQILCWGGSEARHQLEDAKEEIGDDFEKFQAYAAKYSDCPSKKQGGSLGEIKPGKHEPKIDEIIFHGDIGKVHGPVKSSFGYHLIYVESRKGGDDDLKDLKP